MKTKHKYLLSVGVVGILVVLARWGPVWYILGRFVYDDAVMIPGGAEG